MDRIILHCDCNSFFASVELLDHPDLVNVPVAIGGNSENRKGIILAKNEPAKKYGVVTAETIWAAKKKCPDLVILKPNHEKYTYYSKKVNDIYARYTDLIEPFGIDESWLDVTGSTMIFGNGKEIADRIRKEVREELGLTISVGVSFNKIFAKLGSDYKKPDATTVISRDNFKTILFPLKASDMLFVGKKMAAELSKYGIVTIEDIAHSKEGMLENIFGKSGDMVRRYANGEDESPVASMYEKEEVKSVGNGMTFKKDISNIEEAELGIIALADTVAYRLRKKNLKCTTVQVNIKDTNFKVMSRQRQTKNPTYIAKEIAEIATLLVKENWDFNKKRIRLISITGTKLVQVGSYDRQLSLFEENNLDNEKQEEIEKTIDSIKNKYGKKIIKNMALSDNELGIDI